MQNFAYEIAAAFFLAAILMGGSFLRGFFSREILRGLQLAAAGLILAGAGIWIYRSLSYQPSSSPVVTALPEAVKPVQKSKRVEALRESDRKALAAAIAEEAAKSDIPTRIIPGGAEDPVAPVAEKRATKIAKSVGRALHLVPKTQP